MILHGPWIQELKTQGIELTDLERSSVKSPLLGSELQNDVLIGADIAGKLMTGKIRSLETGLVAVETLLGWVIMGKTPDACYADPGCALFLTTLLTREATISDLWRLDSLGILDPVESETREELTQAALEHFEQTVRLTSSGRYEVSLPWITGHPTLPSNRMLALKRLGATVRKLSVVGQLESYQGILKEWEEEWVIEEVFSERPKDHAIIYPTERS